MDEVTGLRHGVPADLGVPARALLRTLDGLEATGEPHGLLVLRRGVVIAETSWAPYRRDRAHLVYSLSKTFTSCAVGWAVDEGLLALDERLVDAFPSAAGGAGPLARRITVEHALRMATGHAAETVDAMLAAARRGEDPVAAFLAQEPAHEPGTRFLYNNGATYLCGALVQERSGRTLTEYLRPRLLEPLGVTQARWIQGPPGRDLGFSGLHVTTESLARLGLLLADDGVWHGRRLLPPGWVVRASAPLTDNREPADAEPGTAPEPDWAQGYGYQLWRGRDGFRGDGAYGQFSVVLPDQDLVVALTGCTEDMQGVLDVLRTELVAALDRPDPDETASLTELERRLTQAEVPAPAGGAEPVRDGPWRFEGQLAGRPAQPDHPQLRSVTVARGEDGGAHRRSWRLVVDDGGPVEVVCGDGWWPDPGGPGQGAGATSYVARGGWTSPEVFEARVVAVDTPHSLLLTCRDGRLTARWNGVPLHAPVLAHLRAP